MGLREIIVRRNSSSLPVAAFSATLLKPIWSILQLHAFCKVIC